jgi:hypothetical protein
MLNGSGLVAKTVEKAGEITEELKTGEYKRCKKCDRDLPIEMFQIEAQNQVWGVIAGIANASHQDWISHGLGADTGDGDWVPH